MYTFEGNIETFDHWRIPFWLCPGMHSTTFDYLFIRIDCRHYRVRIKRTDSLPGFNPAVYGPKKVKLNIDGVFYIANNSFQKYSVQEHDHHSQDQEKNIDGDFPENNHVYARFHVDGSVYSAPLGHYLEA